MFFHSAATNSALAVAIEDYRLLRTLALPTPNPTASGNVLLDALPDGRLLLLNGNEVLAETAVQSGAFATLGALPGFAPSFGPSFLSVSPDGTRAATGDGAGTLYVFDPANPATGAGYAVADYDATWIDNQTLAVANFNGVDVFDTVSLTTTNLIQNVGGASAGITLDAAGNLYTGNGFDFAAGGSDTGWVKGFTAAAWQDALANGTPIDFENAGTPVADLLTAGTLTFDAMGNLMVGGGDFFGGSGDFGYAALVDAAAVADAWANPQAAPPITAASPATDLRTITSPAGAIAAMQGSGWNYNPATGELYLSYYRGDTVAVYGVPEPAGVAMALTAALAAALARRQRR